MENGGTTKDSYTIGEVVARLRPEFPTLSVSKIRYLERRRLITLTRTRGDARHGRCRRSNSPPPSRDMPVPPAALRN